ncbi:MAG: hypothetical protein U0547_10820 [Dehalococcoidia bacterium]
MTLAVEAPGTGAASGGAGRALLLAAVAAVGLVAYLGMRPSQPWILWFTAAVTALAVDGIVRSSPRWEPGGALASAVYTFLPALAVLGSGYFVGHAIDGYPRTAVALVLAAGAGGIALGEYHTVDFRSRLYGSMRLALAVATYLTAFALYTVIYSGDAGVLPGAILIALVSTALGMELLRESRLLGPSSLLAGIAIGVTLGELRLALYFFPLDGLLAGALLIIGFYLATGFVHHLLDHDLEWSTTGEYLLVAAAGTAAVVVTRVFV